MATAPLISIHNVSSSQIPPNAAPIPLKNGTLTLTEPLAGTPTDAKLFLTVTPSDEDAHPLTIPLSPENYIGSKAGLCQTFRFKIPADEDLIIEISFPEDVSEEDALSFEKALVYNGIIKTGFVARADDFSKSITETAASVASYLTKKTDERNESVASPEEDHEFSDITKDIVGGAEKGTGKIAQVTGDVGKIVSGAMYDAGAWIGSKTGLKSTNTTTEAPSEPPSLARETFDQTVEATKIAGKGIGQATVLVGSTIGESASQIAENDFGSEAKDLVDSTRQTGANVGNIAVDAYLGTSMVVHAAEASVGATVAEEKMQNDEKRLEKNA